MTSLPRPTTRALRALLVIVSFVALAALAAPAYAEDPAPAVRLADASDARIAPGSGLHALGAGASAAGDNRIDALLSGYRYTMPSSGPLTITYSFYENDVWHGTNPYGSEANYAEVSDPVKRNVRAALAWYSTMINIDFVEVTESATQVGQLRYLISDGPSYAYAYYPGGTSIWSASSDVHLSSSYDNSASTNGFQRPPGDHGYLTIVHETGHALGLKHPFDGSPNLPAAEDNDSHTMMTYTWNGSSAATPMSYDIMALQYLYGARANHGTDDDYAFTALGLSQYSRDGAITLNSAKTLKQAIWDSGGENDLDCSALPAAAGGYRLDLKPHGWLSLVRSQTATYFTEGTVIGPGVTIRDVYSSGSNDTIYANAASNVFGGYDPLRTTGSDVIWDASAADTVDLSAFAPSQVATAATGDDLLISLGARGSITLKGWALGNRPTLAFSVPEPNLAPTAIISASATSGPSPLSVTFGGAASTDPDGLIVEYLWDFGDGTTANGATAQKTFQTQGTYTVRLTVTDDDGSTSTTTVRIVAGAPVPIARVGAVSVVQVRMTRGSSARATITITNANGTPVAGARVTGRWSGLVPGGVSAVTDAAGRVTFTSQRTSKAGPVHFTVTGVTPPVGVTYAANQNLAGSGSARILP